MRSNKIYATAVLVLIMSDEGLLRTHKAAERLAKTELCYPDESTTTEKPNGGCDIIKSNECKTPKDGCDIDKSKECETPKDPCAGPDPLEPGSVGSLEDSDEEIFIIDEVDTEDDYWYESAEKFDTNSISFRGKLRRQFSTSLIISRLPNSTVCSPISALMPLGKLALGATGKTLSELLVATGFKQLSELRTNFKDMINTLKGTLGVNISIASAIYISDKMTLTKSFQNDAKSVFGAGIETMNFTDNIASADKINHWVSDMTDNMIKRLVSAQDIDRKSSVILVNAIYFSGFWRHRFRKTSDTIFHGWGGDHTVPMMKNTAPYRYLNSMVLDSQLIELPYEGSSRSSMLIIFPNQKSTSVNLLILKTSPETVLMEFRKMENLMIALTVPKFKMATYFDLEKEYRALGLNSMFSGGLDKIVTGMDVKVSKAVQSAVIDFTEQGTTAAAATAVTETKSATPKPQLAVVIDRPFFFMLLVEEQQLFSGLVNDLKTSDGKDYFKLLRYKFDKLLHKIAK